VLVGRRVWRLTCQQTLGQQGRVDSTSGVVSRPVNVDGVKYGVGDQVDDVGVCHWLVLSGWWGKSKRIGVVFVMGPFGVVSVTGHTGAVVSIGVGVVRAGATWPCGVALSASVGGYLCR